MIELDTFQGDERLLTALGVREDEERAYRHLLRHPTLTAGDLAEGLSIRKADAQPLLDQMERRGLVTHTAEQPRRYNATPPRFAIDALVSQQQAELQRVRLAIPQLEYEAHTAADVGDREQLVEIVTDRGVLQQIVRHLHRTAQHELFGFQRLPSIAAHQEEARPGLRVRSISDQEYVEAPGALENLRKMIDMGEEARIFPTLPVKMFVADRRIGLVLNAGEVEGSVLVVRASPLLDALCALFDFIWERATPIGFTREGEFMQKDAASIRLTPANRKIIPMLAAGFNDKMIAHHSAISMATMNRRIAELMKVFDAKTRFQLGWHAALEMMTSTPSAISDHDDGTSAS